MTSSVGFIGLGRMGGGMAKNLNKAFGPVCVFDPLPSAMTPLVEAGATAAKSLADLAARCDLIFMCLPFAPEVRAAIFDKGGIADAARPGLRIVDTTTLYRTDAIAIHEEAKSKGIDYWDCPISGMPFRAHDGTLTMMFGGSDDAFEMAKPYLEAMGKFVVHCGAVGAGQAMKAINNIIYNINIAGICEVLPLTTAVGLDPEKVAAIVTSGSSRSFASEYFVPRMLEGRFDTDFTLKAAHKDIDNVRQMAEATGAHTPVIDAMVDSYDAAIAAGFGDEPKSAMLKIYEKVLGVRFRKPGF